MRFPCKSPCSKGRVPVRIQRDQIGSTKGQGGAQGLIGSKIIWDGGSPGLIGSFARCGRCVSVNGMVMEDWATSL